jgi:hypothetical protein
MKESYWRVRLRYYRCLEPDRIVESQEYAPDGNTAIAKAAAREGGSRDLRSATVEFVP